MGVEDPAEVSNTSTDHCVLMYGCEAVLMETAHFLLIHHLSNDSSISFQSRVVRSAYT
jgi:hypothetical protein